MIVEFRDDNEYRIKTVTNNRLADKSAGKIAEEGKASEQRAYEIQRLLRSRRFLGEYHSLSSVTCTCSSLHYPCHARRLNVFAPLLFPPTSPRPIFFNRISSTGKLFISKTSPRVIKKIRTSLAIHPIFFAFFTGHG